MNQRKVLFISQEIAPYTADTKEALAGRKIPQGIQEKGFEVRTFMPKYGSINERRNQLHEVIRLSGMNVIIDDTDHPLIIKVATLQPTRMQVYFIDNDDYFHHGPSKDLEIHSSTADNDERMMFYVHGVIETVKKLRWEPAVIHCMGWISSLVPLYIKKMYQDEPLFANTKVIYTLDGDKFDYTLDPRFVEKLTSGPFRAEDVEALGSEPVDFVTLNKIAMQYADAIVQSDDTVSQELIDMAAASGKPFMPFTSHDTIAADIAGFYGSLIGEN